MKPCYVWFIASCLALTGCAAPALRSQSPESLSSSLESSTRLVGEVARPFGHTYVKVESVALITGLDGTGEDPAPSPQRSALLHELQTIGVQNPNQLLASPSTTLVLVRGFLPPGVQKGDKFDLDVQVPSHGETTSLRGGWLMETRLTEMGRARRNRTRRASLGHRRGRITGRPGRLGRKGPCPAYAGLGCLAAEPRYARVTWACSSLLKTNRSDWPRRLARRSIAGSTPSRAVSSKGSPRLAPTSGST